MIKKTIVIIIFFITNVSIHTKDAVLVLGMHRSGTSVLTGVLQHMGLYLGEGLISPNSYNPKGYFEHIEINSLNDQILTALGSSWYDPLPLKMPDIPLIMHCIHNIKKTIQKNFEHVEHFGLKDPRLCILLPYYLVALEDLGYTVKFIIILRNPFEIAASLETRDAMPHENALRLTEKYLTSIEAYACKYDSIILKFDSLVNKKEKCVKAISNFLPYLDASQATIDQIIEFVDKDLKHHNITKQPHTISSYMKLFKRSF